LQNSQLQLQNSERKSVGAHPSLMRGHSLETMGIKKRRIEEMERKVEKKFFLFSAVAV